MQGIYKVIADIAVPLTFMVNFFVFLLIDEQRNVLFVEIDSAEKCTSLLQNTCSFPMDNSTRPLHVNFLYISVSVVKCTVYS